MKTVVVILVVIFNLTAQHFRFTIQNNIEITRPDTTRSISEYSDFSCDGRIEKCSGDTYKYDTLGRVIEKVETDENQFDGRTLYKYNG